MLYFPFSEATPTFVVPPQSRIGAVTDVERDAIVKSANVFGFYEKSLDRESAYEILKNRAEQSTVEEKAEEGFDWGGILNGSNGGNKKTSASQSDSILETAAKSAARAIGSQLGRQIIRGVLGSILGGRR